MKNTLRSKILPLLVTAENAPFFKPKTNRLKTLLALVAMVMGMGVSLGQARITEGFESGLPTTYGTGTSYTLGSGTWTGQASGVIRGTTGVKTGTYSLQIRSQVGAQVTTPNMSVGGVSTVTFWGSASTTSGAVQVNYSTDAGSTWSAASGSPFTLTTDSAVKKTATINSTSPNILVQFYRTGAGVYIDDIVINTSEPTTQASAVTFSSVASTAMTASWTNGNGGRRAVFMKSTSGAITNPSDGTAYTASSDWNSKGTQLGTSGYYCIYNGTGSSVALTNLVASTAYYFQVFEYNSNDNTTPTATSINYFTSTATNNPNNQSTSSSSSTVTFNASSGSITTTTQSAATATNLTSASSLGLSRANYTFGGWATSAARATAGTVDYANSASYPFTGGAATLYAIWNTTVSFNASGGTGTMADQTASTSSALTANGFSNSGYTFGGWATSPSLATAGTVDYANSASYPFTGGAATLYAIWNVITSPTISTIGTLVAVSTTYGTASATPTSFSFTGSRLTANIVVTPPPGFEVAVGSGAYSDTQTVTHTSGSIASTTINVRLKATTNAGTYSGNITFVSADNSTTIVATASSTVFKKELTVGTPSIASKVYDATSTSGTVTLGTLSGFVGTETVTATAVSTFADRNVNASKTATIVYTLVDGANGGLSSNYSLADSSVTAAITAKPITLNGLSVPASKVYDGSTIAVVTGSPGSLQSSSAPGAGTTEDGKPYSGDTISLTGTATGTYNDANVANASTVSFGGLSLTGAQSSNYSLTIQSNQAATITKANQTITFGALANQTTATVVDYTPGATSASSGTNAITYISSNLAVATIVNGLIHIVGVGTTNITATQVATTNYNAAADISQSLTVTLVPVSIAIQDFETSPATPTWTYSATGGATNSTTNKFNGAISYRLGNSEILTMDNVDISNYTSVSLSVTFAADGPDSGEDLFMDISYDNGSTWIGSGSVKLVDGFSGTQININNTNVLDPTTVATNPWPTSIAGSETQIRVRFRVVALDASEYYWIDDVKVTGILNTSPIIIRTPASLSGFSQNSVTPSAEQTYTVSGNNLTASVSITPPTGFEISTTSGGSFSATNPIILTQSGGDLVDEPVTIYVRQSLGVLGAVSGNITHASTGASDVNTALSGTRTGTYYYSGSGNLDVLTNWGLNTDGTGSNPSNFTSDGVIYEIRNAATATIGANWTVSGAASKVVVGDGTNATDFNIPSGFSLIGTIDVNNTAELTIENTTSPTFGILAANSTLEYNNVAATLSLSSVLTYGNLKLSGIGTKTFPGHSTNTTKITGNLTLNNTTIDGAGSSPFSTILLAGNLTYVGTVTPPADANSITLSTNGTAAGSQTFMGAGNTLRWFRITTTTANTIVLSTSGGSSNVLLGNATSGGLTLLDGSILNMNGNDFQMFNGGASFILNTTGSISTTTSTDFNIERTITGSLGTMRFTSGSNTIGNLTLNHVGATNTLTIGNALNVNGVITVTDGTLASGGNITLKSDATITSSVAAIGSGGAISGNVTVERYIPAKRAWRALTAPLKGSDTSIFSQWQNNGTVTAGTGVELWGPGGTGSGSTSNGLEVGSNNSILQYDNSSAGAWAAVTDTKTTNLFTTNANNAFMIFPTGGYGSGYISSSVPATETTLKATGQLITGDVPYSSLPNTSHTLIGNPYASPIDLNSILDANTTLEKFFWVWDPKGANQGTYNTFDAAANTYTFTNVSYSNSTVIQSGQAFFVKALTGQTGSFTISESNKSTGSSNAVFRTAAPAELLRVGLYKQINTEWSGRDGAMTVILPDADANQTANKMANGTENVAFTKNSELFASQHHLPLVASDVLNVRVWNTTAGTNYKLKINTEQFNTTNLNATLEDLFTNSRTPLTLNGTAVEYPFAVTTEAASTGNRFRIVFENSALGINNPKASGISILPNPITGDTFQVNLGTLSTGTYSYSISNALGQEVEKGNINNVTQNSNYTVKFKNSTANGMYIMKVTGTDNSVFTAKIIKQ